MASPRTIQGEVNGTGTVTYELPPGIFQYVQAIRVEVDNTGGADARPTLDIAEQAGVVIATKRQGEAIPAGDTGSATWALRLTDESPTNTGPGSLTWAAASITLPGPFVTGVQAGTFALLDTNDLAAFSIDGAGRLVFHKTGVYAVVHGWWFQNDPFAPLAAPWTQGMQGGPNSTPGALPFFTLGNSQANGTGKANTNVQVWSNVGLYVTTIDAAHVGGHMGWGWQNFGPATLVRVASSVLVLRLSEVP